MSGFSTTRWSLVLSAQDGSRLALAELLRSYWYALWAFARRAGYGVHDAQDLTQGYFLRFIERDFLSSVDADRGRFRSFLLASFKHYLSNERDRASAVKRGGGERHLTLDFEGAEARYLAEAAEGLGAEELYDRRWALTLLDRALARLEAEQRQSGGGRRFDVLRAFLTSDGDGVSYSRVGRELGIEEGAVKVAVHRLRKRYGEVLRAEVAETAVEGADVDEELRALLHAVSAR